MKTCDKNISKRRHKPYIMNIKFGERVFAMKKYKKNDDPIPYEEIQLNGKMITAQ